MSDPIFPVQNGIPGIDERFVELAALAEWQSDLQVATLAGYQAGYDAACKFHGIAPLANVVRGETQEDRDALGKTPVAQTQKPFHNETSSTKEPR